MIQLLIDETTWKAIFRTGETWGGALDIVSVTYNIEVEGGWFDPSRRVTVITGYSLVE